MSNELAIKEKLVQFWKTRDKRQLLPALCPEAQDLVYRNPFAFLLAGCLDRGMVADIVWTFPLYIQQVLGHLDPFRIAMMNVEQIQAMFQSLPKRPRYMRDAPRTVKELAAMVSVKLGGDATKLWENRTAREVQNDLMNLYGVGRGIAAMIVILLHRLEWVEFPDLYTIPVKPDVHVQRVMYRMGLSDGISEAAATCAAQRLNPQFPGELDSPLWVIGRQWCFAIPGTQDCPCCPITDICPRVGL
jgi:endonuclease III